MSFIIEYDKQPIDFLRKAQKQISQRILDKIDEQLIENPVPHDAKRLQGYNESTFRIRVGDYRALYRVNHEAKRIIVIKIDKRERVYS